GIGRRSRRCGCRSGCIWRRHARGRLIVLPDQTRRRNWHTPVVRLLNVQAACSLAHWLRVSARLADGSIGSGFESQARIPTDVRIPVVAVGLSFVAPGAAFAWVE